MDRDILGKIFTVNLPKWQLRLAFPGLMIGLLFLLGAIQVNADLRQILNDKGSASFTIINKKVSLLNTLGLKGEFLPEEIEELKKHPEVLQVGQFTANEYKVSATSKSLGFYTELFFESVEDAFLEPDLLPFEWKQGDEEVPIILSKDYLALYNFGFAPSQGLPQFTQGTIKKVSLTITLRGKGLSSSFRGRIAGFSEQINSILVPQSFMDWANQRFGSGSSKGSSRLILELKNPQSKALSDFLEERSYEKNKKGLAGEGLRAAVQSAALFMGFLGISIFGLSLLVLILTYQLILARSSLQIQRLLEIGYSPSILSQFLSRNFLITFLIIGIGAGLLLFAGHYFLASYLIEQGFPLSLFPSFFTIIIWVLILLSAAFFPRFIYRKILEISK